MLRRLKSQEGQIYDGLRADHARRNRSLERGRRSMNWRVFNSVIFANILTESFFCLSGEVSGRQFPPVCPRMFLVAKTGRRRSTISRLSTCSVSRISGPRHHACSQSSNCQPASRRAACPAMRASPSIHSRAWFSRRRLSRQRRSRTEYSTQTNQSKQRASRRAGNFESRNGGKSCNEWDMYERRSSLMKFTHATNHEIDDGE